MPRIQGLKDFEYMNHPQHADLVAALLTDRRDAMAAGPSQLRHMIRVCDLAIDTLDQVPQHPFSFSSGKGRRYSDRELAEAGRVVRGVRP